MGLSLVDSGGPEPRGPEFLGAAQGESAPAPGEDIAGGGGTSRVVSGGAAGIGGA